MCTRGHITIFLIDRFRKYDRNYRYCNYQSMRLCLLPSICKVGRQTKLKKESLGNRWFSFIELRNLIWARAIKRIRRCMIFFIAQITKTLPKRSSHHCVFVAITIAISIVIAIVRIPVCILYFNHRKSNCFRRGIGSHKLLLEMHQECKPRMWTTCHSWQGFPGPKEL